MSLKRKIKQRTQRRKQRVRSKFKTSSYPRISVFRSLKNIYAQVIDDNDQKTLASYSTLELKEQSGDKKAVAKTVGLELAKRALSKGIDRALFDRGSYRYHGRVKELAEGLKEGGLKI